MRRIIEGKPAEPVNPDAHKILKAMRIYLGMSQTEAAKKVGISLCVYSKYENVSGELLKGSFCVVYRILEVMHLNPKKFMQGKYELNALGHQITSRGTGPINHILRNSLRTCCPVTLKSKVED